jgi:glucosylceramidase
MRRAFVAAALVAAVGCGLWRHPVPVASGSAPVQVWITTGDQSKLLSREPDLSLGAASATSLPVLLVDTATAFQRMIGFGAARRCSRICSAAPPGSD